MEGFTKLGIDLKSLIFYLVNFGVIVFILAKWVYKPLLRFLDERRDTIAKNLEASENLKQEFAHKLAEKEAESEKKIKELQAEISESKQTAASKARELIAEAEVEKQRIIDQAKGQSDILYQQLASQIEEDLLNKVARLVETAMRKSADPEDVASEVKKAWKQLQNER